MPIEYSKYDPRYIREHATKVDEIALAEMEADREIGLFLGRIEHQPNFTRRVLKKLAPQLRKALGQEEEKQKDRLEL